jgi:hypothetical protein
VQKLSLTLALIFVSMGTSFSSIDSSALNEVQSLSIQESPSRSEYNWSLNNTAETKPKAWYEKLSMSGYTQIRYNRLLETNPDLKCEQCDGSLGTGQGFFVRRLRFKLSGYLNPRLYMYFQTDFASTSNSSSLHYAQVRDAYFDYGLTEDNTWRIRFGQSKIPYGFENMQSSQNRLPLDRNDGINSAVKNERDLGFFVMWAPEEKRKMYSRFVKENLKGSGDYGCLAFGLYNGQGANYPEANDNLHAVARFSYPMTIGNQIIEPAIQAYTGKYTLYTSKVTSGVKVNDDYTYTDRRAAGTFVLYPQPFGIQAEYNIGEGPQYNPATNSIDLMPLKGGYATLSYKIDAENGQCYFPFVRYTSYQGGKKFEQDARSYDMKELELGLEWQIHKNMELVAMYSIADRRYEDGKKPDNQQVGNRLRLQLQFNY